MSLPVCKFYSQNRNCKFGKNCRYLHSSFQGPPSHFIGDNQHEAVNIPKDSQHISLDCLRPVLNSYQESNNELPIEEKPSAYSLSNSDSPTVNQKKQNENHKLEQSSEAKGAQKVCHYFLRHGRCAFGRNCRFSHNGNDVPDADNVPNNKPKDPQRREVPPRFQRKTKTSALEDVGPVEGNEKVSSISDTSMPEQMVYSTRRSTHLKPAFQRQSFAKICSYFKSGNCRRGRNCQYSHSLAHQKVKDNFKNPETESEPTESKELETTQNLAKQMLQERFRAYKPPRIQQFINLSNLEAEGTEKYRKFDINFLQRRFGDWKNRTHETDKKADDDCKIDVTFEPSDPDWPFDIKSFELRLVLPKNYPKEHMTVQVPIDKQELPETVRRYLEVSFAEWISDRVENIHRGDNVELMVRPFFKWMDRNLEDVLTEALKQLKRELAAKAAGLEFIPAHQLKAKYNVTDAAGDEGTESEENDGSLSEDSDSSEECLNSDLEDNSSDIEDEDESKSYLRLDAEKKGTEIQLRSLQLKQNTTSLLFEKLRVIIQCSRCKHLTELTITHGKVMSLVCEKCSYNMLISYRPSLVHQFSSVIGYLDLKDCQAFDLIFQDCVIAASCLGCSKLTKINGMVSGQMMDNWCHACNARLKFATESVKFYHLEPSSIDLEKGHVEVVHSKKKKPPKNPAIREGYPLPEFGTCKHYKQSYRWLRFPCCGKAYPCDVCHDSKEDHEMTIANRMICGHCCKEQNFSGKACTSCNQHMTKVHSSHWEGGTGCRDKISMSRSDQQKYKNMNKTLSNHKKKVQSSGGSKKKITKLRHV